MAALQQHWKTLSISIADAIMTVSLNRPKVNAMSTDMLNELDQAFRHAASDATVKGVHLRSNMKSTFCAGLDLSDMYERCSKRQRPLVDKFVFDTLPRGLTAPIRCTKPVACSLDGHAIAGGIILALACDHIAIGTRKTFQVGITELAVGVPFPTVALSLIRHQLEPQLCHRLTFDANLVPSTDFDIPCERSDTPDDLSRKWLKMVTQRPLRAFGVTKKNWWADFMRLLDGDFEHEKQQYFEIITGDDCLQAMKSTLKK